MEPSLKYMGIHGSKTRQQPGLHFGVGIQVIIDAVRKGDTKLLQPFRLPSYSSIASSLVIKDGRAGRCTVLLPLQPPPGVDYPDVVLLNPLEVVFTLSVQQAENSIGICFAINMRYAKVISNNGDIGSLLLPADHSVLVFSVLHEEKLISSPE